ncbi:MAG TPA: methyltransferase domain-containing protein [Chitinophagaceae bacterium]|nr:methyltransferase domain-containing protein [Chitinophagaceae bacterium]
MKAKDVLRYFKRKSSRPNWLDLRKVHPVSRTFGLDRGTPIDRYYIENFLKKESGHIQGTVLEIAESTYSRKFGQGVNRFEVLHTRSGKGVTLVGDLTRPDTLPAALADCFICTQTFNFIYDLEPAVRGAWRLLKPGGVLLATMAGISQISRYDMDRWGDFWRFTTKSAQKLFSAQFGEDRVVVQSHGNVLSAIAFLEGIAVEEMTLDELDHQDEDYQLLLTVKAIKKAD